ncbi:MAG: hypothetical protein K5651_05655 [Bacteroidales bacterium]|nr:hypothetical protein [Bacteroidales bacterium]
MKSRALFAFLAASILLVACKKHSSLIDIDPGDEALKFPQAEDIQPALPIVLHERFSWKSGDKIMVKGNESREWKMLPGNSSSFARFSGDDVTGNSFSVSYSEAGVEALNLNHIYNIQSRQGNKERPALFFTISGLTSLKDSIILGQLPERAEYKSNGLLSVDLIFPKQVVYLNALTIKALRPIFQISDRSTNVADSMRLEYPQLDAGLFKQRVTAHFQASCSEIEIREGERFDLIAFSGNRKVKTSFSLPAGRYKSGYDLIIDLTENEWDTGGEEHFVINTIDDLLSVREKIASDITSFELASDIDVSSVEWIPLIDSGERYINFDGSHHKIIGLNVKSGVNYPSFFGRLCGKVNDLEFVNPVVCSDKDAVNPSAVLAACSSATESGMSTLIKNVRITGASLTVSAAQASPCGFIAGEVYDTHISDCYVAGSIIHSGKDAEINVGSLAGKLNSGCCVEHCISVSDVSLVSGRVAGGFIGSIRGESQVSDCSFNGNLSSNGTYSGGFIGHIAGTAEIRNCSSNATVTNGTGNIGGFIGSLAAGAKESSLRNCTANIDLSASGDMLGGLIGSLRAASVLIDSCQVKGNVVRTDAKSYTGGLVGSMGSETDAVIIRRCSYSGTMNSNGYRTSGGNGSSLAGGLIGYANPLSPKNEGVIIENCYTSGKAYDFNHRFGGIIGVPQDGYIISSCYSSMELESRHGIGGIVGAEDAGGNNKTTSDVTIDKCIAWNPSISSLISGNIGTVNPSGNLSCGAVTGRAMAGNVHSSCVRRSDMVFNCMIDDFNTLYDQDDSNAGTPLVWNYSATYYAPYHGKVAQNGENLSAVAIRLGWDAQIWDFSTATPKFK